MGRDKALIEWDGRPLVVQVAERIRFVTGSVTLVGPRNRYDHLGLPILEDEHRGAGPLSGIVAALESSPSERALVVGCDMARLDGAFLKTLCRKSMESNGFDAWVGESRTGGLEPLCAVYHVRAASRLLAALLAKRLKMRDLLMELRIARVSAEDDSIFENVNTPDDLAALART